MRALVVLHRVFFQKKQIVILIRIILNELIKVSLKDYYGYLGIHLLQEVIYGFQKKKHRRKKIKKEIHVMYILHMGVL